jgi:hypothetical protein
MRVVIVAEADQRTNDRQLVGQGREPRQVFADIGPRHARGDGPEFAADLDGSVRFRIEGVEVRRAAGQQHHDDALGPVARRPRRALGLGSQEVRQRQAAQRETADLQPAAARQALAMTPLRGRNREHGPTSATRMDGK